MRVLFLEAVDPELRRARLARIGRKLIQVRRSIRYTSKVIDRVKGKSDRDATLHQAELDNKNSRSQHPKLYKLFHNGRSGSSSVYEPSRVRPGILHYTRSKKALKLRAAGDIQTSWKGGRPDQSDWLSRGNLWKGSTYRTYDKKQWSFTGKHARNGHPIFTPETPGESKKNHWIKLSDIVGGEKSPPRRKPPFLGKKK